MSSNFTFRNSLDYNKIFLVLIGVVLLSSLVPFQSSFAVSVNFDSPKKDLGDGGGISTITLEEGAKLESSQNNVYTLWREGTKIIFSSSSNQGSTFSTLANPLGDTNLKGGQGQFTPQIDSFGNNVYALWGESTAPGSDISFRKSIDNGGTFSAKIILSSNTGLADNISQNPQIAVSNSNELSSVWFDRDGSNPPNGFILFKSGKDFYCSRFNR